MKSDNKKQKRKVIKVEKIPSCMKKGICISLILIMMFLTSIGLTGCTTEEKVKNIPGYNIEYVDSSDHIYKTEEGEYFYKTDDVSYAIPVEGVGVEQVSKNLSYLEVVNALDEFDDLKEFLTSYGIESALEEYKNARQQSDVQKLNAAYSKVALITLKGMVVANHPIKEEIESIKITPVEYDFISNYYEECVVIITCKPENKIVPGGIEVAGEPKEYRVVVAGLGDYFESIIKAQEGIYSIKEIDELYTNVINFILKRAEPSLHGAIQFVPDTMKRLELKYTQ